MRISTWPKSERPREKLITKGAASLSDAELLAIFVRSGTRDKTALDIARDALNYFGDLRFLLDADQKKFCSLAGLGDAKYAELQAALEISRRYLFASLSSADIVSSIDQAKAYFTMKLRGAKHEIFACLFLDNQNQVISYEELFCGSINEAHIYPREVIKKVLQHNATSVIFAHNHISRIADPSLADREITRRLQKCLASIEVKILDHLIIGKEQVISFAEHGFL